MYPLNEMIEKLLASAVDEESGEVLLTDEELEAKLEEINLEFDETIKALRNSFKQTKLDAEIVKAEAQALLKAQQDASKRAKALENKADRIKRYIAWLLKGEPFDKDGVKISQTSRTDIVVDDGFLEWAKVYAPRLLNEPTVRKADVNTAFKSGQRLEFVHSEERKDIRIK